MVEGKSRKNDMALTCGVSTLYILQVITPIQKIDFVSNATNNKSCGGMCFQKKKKKKSW